MLFDLGAVGGDVGEAVSVVCFPFSLSGKGNSLSTSSALYINGDARDYV